MLLRKKTKRMRLASARRPVLGVIVPMTFLLGAGEGELPKEGKESREKKEATISGNCDVFRHKFNVILVTLRTKNQQFDREINNDVFVSIKYLERYITFALRMPRMFTRYKEPASMPQTPGKMDLFQEDSRSCRKENQEDYQSNPKDTTRTTRIIQLNLWYCLPEVLQDI